MTLQSRLLGVFAQYPDPRVGFFTTEIVGSAAPRRQYRDIFGAFGFVAPRYLMPQRYLMSERKEPSGGLILALLDVEDKNKNKDEDGIWRSGDYSTGRFGWLPLLSETDMCKVACYWTTMLQQGKYYEAAVDLVVPTKYDALVPWLAVLVARSLREVRKETLTVKDMYGRFQTFSQNLSNVADWGHATHPNLMSLSWNQALYRSRRWHAALARQTAAKVSIPGEVVYRFSDGWTVQRLTTQLQLKNEGTIMGHCVGGSDVYLKGIQSGALSIFSLRDPAGHPHVTFEIVASEIRQAKLRGNDTPRTFELCQRILEAASALNWIAVYRAGNDPPAWIVDLRTCPGTPDDYEPTYLEAIRPR